jgi:circadian clock protein KaiC
MADVVIDLNYQVAGWRHTRRLDVVKQRGRPALPGLHSYTINGDGIVAYPRLESRLPELPPPPAEGLAAFGIPELDALLAGGIPTGTTAVLLAAPGAGKTTLALRWALAEARTDQATLFLSFHASPRQLEVKAAALGLDLAAAIASGACALLHLAPVAIDPDATAALLMASLRPSTRRVIIDDLSGLLWELGPRARDYLAALALHLAHAGVTTLLLLDAGENPPFHLDAAYPLIAPVAETVIALEEQVVEGQVRHMARLVTSRYGAYEPRQRATALDTVARV